MNEAPTSPKRRHILSSINPESDLPRVSRRRDRSESRSLSPKPLSNTKNASETSSAGKEYRENDGDDDRGDDDKTRPRRSRLKLKGHRTRNSSRDRNHERDRERRSHHSSSSRRHRRHRSRRSRSPTPPNPHDAPPLDPDAAFRESLFDAMADDEGASYWEAVYGQPVHVYPQEQHGPDGELERMTDDEYATYVRQRMWEKTHAGLLEEKERREQRRKQKAREDRHNRKLQEEMEHSLKRGEERRARRKWASLWEGYSKAWTEWDGSIDTIAWPVESGQRDDIAEEAVRTFLLRGLGMEDLGKDVVVGKLKDERVRWHPDKMQQRLGDRFDEQVMKDVTAVFQIIDRLWADMRKPT